MNNHVQNKHCEILRLGTQEIVHLTVFTQGRINNDGKLMPNEGHVMHGFDLKEWEYIAAAVKEFEKQESINRCDCLPLHKHYSDTKLNAIINAMHKIARVLAGGHDIKPNSAIHQDLNKLL